MDKNKYPRFNGVTYNKMLKQHLDILKELQYNTGLFAASKATETGYDKSWLRDNFYECLAFERIGDWETVQLTYRSLMDIFIKHESKIDEAIKRRPKDKQEYIHARFHPHTFEEFWEDWGNKQNDSVGAILFMLGELDRKGKSVLENEKDIEIVNKLVKYLESVEYWHDEDSGMWEENEEVHASSVGACLAGLKSVQGIKGVKVPEWMIANGRKTLDKLLPRESKSKFVDLALLSLVYPYNIVSKQQEDEIVENVRYHLERRKGVIRYKGDYYYNKNPDGYSEEAEWCFGFSWLAIIYEMRGEKKKAKAFIERARETIDAQGYVPELYFSNSDKPGPNTPLGWAESLFLVALYNLYRMG